MKKLKIDFLSIILLINMLFAGAFFEYVSCLTSILLIGYLIYLYKKNGKLIIRKNISLIAIAVLVLFYGISCFWAIDGGMAFIGFFKFLPLLLFALVRMQGEGKESIRYMPYALAIITVVTGILMHFDAFKDDLTVAGRLAGTFQYPNTFAIVLLVSQLMLLKKEKRSIIDYISMLIILAGIFLSGSRTVLVFTAVFHLIYFLFNRKKKEKLIFFGCMFGAVALFIGFCFITKRTSLLERILSISIFESTFVGRLLYSFDAIKLVLKNPLGTGYLGYKYLQGTVQTGVYSVTYVHNDFMQIFLDAGWIAGILFIWATVKNILKKENRMYLCALALHLLLDFSFQFIFVSMLYLYFFDFEEGKEKPFILNFKLTCASGGLIAAACLYMGLSLVLPYVGQTGLACKMYPYNTQISVIVMNAQNNIESANKVAQQILKYNQHEQNAYEIAARYAAAQGDISGYISYKRKSIDLNQHNFTADMDYCEALMNCMVKYEETGDTKSYNICQRELYATAKRIKTSKERLSLLGTMIDEQPATYVPSGVLKYANYQE